MRIIPKKNDFKGDCDEWQLEWPVASGMWLEESDNDSVYAIDCKLMVARTISEVLR
jgi:hypothetical protein